MKALFKGIDAVKHKLNLTRVKLALQEKRWAVCQALNANKDANKCLIEINESKIEILKLENKIIKYNGRLLLHQAH